MWWLLNKFWLPVLQPGKPASCAGKVEPNPKGKRRKQYLPYGVIMWQVTVFLLSRLTASTFDNNLAPASWQTVSCFNGRCSLSRFMNSGKWGQYKYEHYHPSLAWLPVRQSRGSFAGWLTPSSTMQPSWALFWKSAKWERVLGPFPHIFARCHIMKHTAQFRWLYTKLL